MHELIKISLELQNLIPLLALNLVIALIIFDNASIERLEEYWEWLCLSHVLLGEPA